MDAETGAPVRGATLDLVSSDAAMFFVVDEPGLAVAERNLQSPFGSRITGTTTANATGAYLFEHGPARPAAAGRGAVRAGTLQVSADGYALATLSFEAGAPGSEQTLDARLFPAATVRGRLVGADGVPQGGRHVVVVSDADRGSRAAGVTDEEGRFRVAQVPAPRRGARATVIVVVRGPETVATPDVFGGQEVDLGEIGIGSAAAPNAAHVRVLVLDEGRRPIWGARVERSDPQGRSFTVGGSITDRAGRTSVPGPGKDGVVIWAWASGYVPATARRGSDVPSQEETTLVLVHGLGVAGRVIGPDDRPVGGVTIGVRRPGEPEDAAGAASLIDAPGAGITTTRTRSDGTFEVRDLAAGAWFVTATGRPERAGAPAPTVTSDAVQAGARDVVLRLPRVEAPPSVRAEVSVVDDATGESVERAVVRFRRGERRRSGRAPTPPVATWPPRCRRARWDVRVSADGHGLLVLHDVVLEDGRPAPPIEARLRPAPAAPK